MPFVRLGVVGFPVNVNNFLSVILSSAFILLTFDLDACVLAPSPGASRKRLDEDMNVIATLQP